MSRLLGFSLLFIILAVPTPLFGCTLFGNVVKTLTQADTAHFADELNRSGIVIIPSSLNLLPSSLGETIYGNMLFRPFDPNAIVHLNELRARISLDHQWKPEWLERRSEVFLGSQKPTGWMKEVDLSILAPALAQVARIMNQGMPNHLRGKGQWMQSFRQTMLVVEFIPGRRRRYFLPKVNHWLHDSRHTIGVHVDKETERRTIFYLKGPGGYFNTSGTNIERFDKRGRFRKSLFRQANELDVVIINGDLGAKLLDSIAPEHSDADYGGWRIMLRQDWVWVPNQN